MFYKLLLILCLPYFLYAELFQWGNTIKTNISKKEINTIIKNYVDENYPIKVEQYLNSQKVKRENEILKYSDNTFVNQNLMWQDNKNVTANKYNILESKIYCRKLNLANKKNWRIPTYAELITIVDYEKLNPSSLDKINFIKPKKYWSSSIDINDKLKYWYVDFEYGETKTTTKNNQFNLRCVRDITSKNKELSNPFVKKQNIVIDKTTNLMWQDNSDTTDYLETITMSKTYCNNLILNSYTNWKMPTVKQLQTIIDVTKKKYTVKKQFKYTKQNKYWSLTPNINIEDKYWYVDFEKGIVEFDKKEQEYSIRCVRKVK